MPTKKYTDWRTWWDGLRTNLIKCLGTTGSAFMVSNGIAATVPNMQDIAIGWKSAILFFMAHMGKEFFDYVKDNQPKVITETVETSFVAKSTDGSTVTQGSKTTTETPTEQK